MAITNLIDSNAIPIVTALVLLYAFYHYVVYPIYLSPLSCIPGPKLAALSALYLDIPYVYETAIPLIYTLHQKYGPIVRVGPSEVAINSPEQLQIIYGIRSTFSKPQTAILFQNYSHPNSFSAIGKDEHRERRRGAAKIYTMNAILNNAPLVEFLQNSLQKVSDVVENNLDVTLDIWPWMQYFALDNVSKLVYGESFGMLDGNDHLMAKALQNNAIVAAPIIRFPNLFTWVLLYCPALLLPQWLKGQVASRDEIEKRNRAQVEKASRAAAESNPDHSLVASLSNNAEYGKTIGDGNILSESCDHVAAGGDTTAATAAYLLYSLAVPENRPYQNRLRAELLSAPVDASLKEICHLPFLNTLVLESLRLNPSGPGALYQRSTPGDPKLWTISVDGKTYQLPAGTMIGVQQFSMHRRPEVYGKNVDEFRPERWEQADEAQLAKMRESWIPFGYGARTCIGQSLALMEVKALVATLLREHTVEIPANYNREDMKPCYAAVIRPKSHRCELVFRRISDH